MYVFPQKLYNFATGKRFNNIFPKLFLQWVDIHEGSSQVHGWWSVGVRRGVAGPRPFLKTLINLNYLHNYYKKTVEYFCIILFALSRYYCFTVLVQTIFENFVEHGGAPKGAWHGHAHFFGSFFSNFVLENGSIFLHNYFCIELVLI